MRGKVFLNTFAKELNREDFNIKDIETNNILRNRLFFFLKTMGYGYASLGILRRILKKEEYRFFEINEILQDCNLRKKLYSDCNVEEIICYDRNIGLNKAYKINNSKLVDNPLSILWNDKEIFNCINLKESLLINININQGAILKDNKEELIAIIFGREIRKYKFLLYEKKGKINNTSSIGDINSIVKKIRRKMELGSFPLYDLIILEEKFIKNPFVTSEVIDVLKELYLNSYYSEDSIKVIKILNKTLDFHMQNEDILLIESREEDYNSQFMKKLYISSENGSSDKLDFIINKVINKEFKFYEPFLKTIYSFYKRNNDMNALMKYMELCIENNIEVSEYGFTKIDKIRLGNYLNTLKKMGYKVMI